MITLRSYGTTGPSVLLLHGGPGAIGTMAPLARELATDFQVIEPFQRRSGPGEQLTVERHIADLHEVIAACCPAERPALVGSSWGAMLALAYAAAHPGICRSLALIGCGTFDERSRQQLGATLDERMSEEQWWQLSRLAEVTDADERLGRLGELLLPIYSCDLQATDLELMACDAKGHRESWHDMTRLQDEGVYPASFSAIEAPVLMLHGAVDPHPGRLVYESLAPHIAQLEYREWERCGHYPWLERAARDPLLGELHRQLSRSAP